MAPHTYAGEGGGGGGVNCEAKVQVLVVKGTIQRPRGAYIDRDVNLNSRPMPAPSDSS